MNGSPDAAHAVSGLLVFADCSSCCQSLLSIGLRFALGACLGCRHSTAPGIAHLVHADVIARKSLAARWSSRCLLPPFVGVTSFRYRVSARSSVSVVGKSGSDVPPVVPPRRLRQALPTRRGYGCRHRGGPAVITIVDGGGEMAPPSDAEPTRRRRELRMPRGARGRPGETLLQDRGAAGEPQHPRQAHRVPKP